MVLNPQFWGQEVAGSSPVVPTFHNIWPFGKNVEWLSLYQEKTYVYYANIHLTVELSDFWRCDRV
jgi:hypothetical protein